MDEPATITRLLADYYMHSHRDCMENFSIEYANAAYVRQKHRRFNFEWLFPAFVFRIFCRLLSAVSLPAAASREVFA